MKALLVSCAMVAMLLGGAGAQAQLHSAAAPAQQKDSGFLDVASDPKGAKISIDDADTGKATPQTQLPLKVGHHKLTLATPDGLHSRTIGFTIAAGQTTKLTIHLSS